MILSVDSFCACIKNWQVWASILLFLWCGIQGRATDMSMCILGWGLHSRFGNSTNTTVWAMVVGFVWVPAYDDGCIFRWREISAGIDPEISHWWIQSHRPPSLPIPTTLYRFLCRCHEGSPSASMARTIRVCDQRQLLWRTYPVKYRKIWSHLAFVEHF